MKKILLILTFLASVFAASPTGPGTFLLKRTATGQPVDLIYFDSVWNLGSGLRRSGDTIYLDYSGVLPGTYGDATHVPQVTIDSFGRATNITNVAISGSGGGGGTVTSVGLALPASVFTVSGSPIVGSGTLTGSFASQSANTAFMAPNGASGTPTFRAFLPGDISFLTDSITAARVYALNRIHDTSLVLRQRIADTAAALRLALTDPTEVRAIVHDTSLAIRIASTLQAAYNASTSPQITTSVTKGPLTLQRGSTSDTDSVLVIRNGAGATAATVSGAGQIRAKNLVLSGHTGDAPISVAMNYSNAYAHAMVVNDSGLTAGQRLTVDFGQAASTNNQANFGFAYAGAGSTANKITLGLYGNNDLVTIAGTGVMTVRDLGTGLVRASSGALSSSALVAADIPALDASKITAGTFADTRIASAATWNAKLSTVTADATSRAANTFYAAPNGAAGAATFRAIVAADIPTLNQNTTGSAAKWTTPRTLTIGATGKALDGSANVSWSLADIGAAAASSLASYLPLAGGTLNSGAQIATNKDITPSASANTNYVLAPIVAQRSSNSGTTTVAAVGFHNLGVNAAALYYDAATSVFRYNRHTGNIVTIWDASNLTNLNQLTNGPGYITSAGSISGNAATATLAANSTNLGGVNSAYFVQGNGAGPYGHRTAEVSSFNTLLPSGFYDNRNGISPLTTGWTHMIRSAHSDPGSGSATWSFDLAANFYTPVNGQQEGYYVRVNEGSNWGTWRTLWHSGNLSASTLPGGPYLPTAAGSVHSPGAYSNTGPTLMIGDGQYGLSANGGNLQLWAAPGGYVSTTAKLWANGAIGSSVSLSAGGGIMRAYNSGAYGIWGTGVADNNSAFSMAADNNGAWAWINGTSQSGLVVGGIARAVASVSGLAVTGSLSATGALSWGGAATIPSSDYVVQGNGAGALGHRTTKIIAATATPTQSGFYDAQSPADGPQGAVWTHMIRNTHTSGGGAAANQWMFDIAATFGGGTATEGVEGYYVRTIWAGSTPGWRQLWHSGNLSASTLPGGPYLPLAGGVLSGSLGLTGSASVAVQALVGLSTRVATINSSGQLGVTSYNANGPWLPQAGGVVTGMLQADGGIRLPHLRVTGNTTLSGPGIISVNATCTVTLPTPSVSNLGWVIWINSVGAYTVTINTVSGPIIGYTPGISGVGRQTFQGVQTGTSTYAWLCGA